MSMAINSAINAYQNASNVTKGAGINPSFGSDSAVNNAFSGLIEKPLANSVSSLRNAESVAMGSLTKQADITDVVVAVTKAESTLKTVVAVRDKMIGAFQELSKMPI